MIIVYITCKDEQEAVKISKHLLNKRIIACSNIHPIRSMYWWNKKIEDEKEFALIAKTKEKNYKNIKEEVKKLHSYDVPCILKIDAGANENYAKWVNEIVK
ncbi:MAG: divalent-cation tolerance protein CutA [Candidatus Woesearchaeota archaeon]|jgi:periplasmic divalent cation tolerance protein|nr:divalent-cation tolerance protein CutA [Candidatus Woesearchaeota archaeon]MDP6265990.1 divalent-cation tolerance protein CutA [Candidatus Woesearchaeota archaeon]MDP7322553.1 divalent-cation tolerance protein CutA [Candidatus Woesearchaeota archaeon]MDP7476616.1 divalent-cation tolerance protein CutA [Candidatus Woesearchaeota archaeon]HJO02166.1 divalent-cation tolerance protein CutA [Candidatus Woesearchaeota archaeon]|tara:strand:- start:5 stop:307 length:303 start_codon:yes stop_codon:yes gene_type:complete